MKLIEVQIRDLTIDMEFDSVPEIIDSLLCRNNLISNLIE
jgi:hypothetical protein